MNKSIFTRIKEYLIPVLDRSSSTGSLSDKEHRKIYSLLQVLADSEECPEIPCRKHVSLRTETQPGYLKEYRYGLSLLDKKCKEMYPGSEFHTLTFKQRNTLLQKLLRPYPYPDSESKLRRKTKVTSNNLDIIFGRITNRRFRDFVVRDLLLHYYTSAAGWSVVGYNKEFPGKVRYESEHCEVVSFKVDDEILLRLSDSTYEQLNPETLKIDDQYGLSAKAKSGRQKIFFQRQTYYDFCDHLEETEEGMVLNTKSQRYKVLRNDKK